VSERNPDALRDSLGVAYKFVARKSAPAQTVLRMLRALFSAPSVLHFFPSIRTPKVVGARCHVPSNPPAQTVLRLLRAPFSGRSALSLFPVPPLESQI
jgi:hypothetical protein